MGKYLREIMVDDVVVFVVVVCKFICCGFVDVFEILK